MQARYLIHHLLTHIPVPSAASLKALSEKYFSLQLVVCTEKNVLQRRVGNRHGFF